MGLATRVKRAPKHPLDKVSVTMDRFTNPLVTERLIDGRESGVALAEAEAEAGRAAIDSLCVDASAAPFAKESCGFALRHQTNDCPHPWVPSFTRQIVGPGKQRKRRSDLIEHLS